MPPPALRWSTSPMTGSTRVKIMKRYSSLLVISILVLTGCGAGPNQPTSKTGEKIEGPPVKTLSHEQLMVIYAECTQYGRMDEPTVKHTIRYCSAINNALRHEVHHATA